MKKQWRITDWSTNPSYEHYFTVQVKYGWLPFWFKPDHGTNNMHNTIEEAEAYVANHVRKAPGEGMRWPRKRVYKQGQV